MAYTSSISSAARATAHSLMIAQDQRQIDIVDGCDASRHPEAHIDPAATALRNACHRLRQGGVQCVQPARIVPRCPEISMQLAPRMPDTWTASQLLKHVCQRPQPNLRRKVAQVIAGDLDWRFYPAVGRQVHHALDADGNVVRFAEKRQRQDAVARLL